ncbi:MAG: hypothetical protein V4629_02265 [Pseudomonadota bacterium]
MNDMPAPTRENSLKAAFSETKPALDKLALDFLVAHNGIHNESYDKNQDEIKLRNGDLNPEQVSRIISVPRSIMAAQAEKKRKAEQTDSQLIAMSLLNDMRERLEALEANMAQSFEKLREKYGDDVIGGMSDTYLTEEERAGLKTDDEKLKALSDKFLNKNGEIKGEYAHLSEAQYVRDWTEAQKIKPIVEKYNGRDYLTIEEGVEVTDAATDAGLADNKNKITISINNEYQATIDKTLDENRHTQEKTYSTAQFNFSHSP